MVLCVADHSHGEKVPPSLRSILVQAQWALKGFGMVSRSFEAGWDGCGQQVKGSLLANAEDL